MAVDILYGLGFNMQITKANWQDLPNIKIALARLESERDELQKQINEFEHFIQKLSQITYWSGDTPFKFWWPSANSLVVTNLTNDKEATIYINTHNNQTYGVYTRDSDHWRSEQWLGSGYTREEAYRLAYEWVGYKPVP